MTDLSNFADRLITDLHENGRYWYDDGSARVTGDLLGEYLELQASYVSSSGETFEAKMTDELHRADFRFAKKLADGEIQSRSLSSESPVALIGALKRVEALGDEDLTDAAKTLVQAIAEDEFDYVTIRGDLGEDETGQHVVLQTAARWVWGNSQSFVDVAEAMDQALEGQYETVHSDEFTLSKRGYQRGINDVIDQSGYFGGAYDVKDKRADISKAAKLFKSAAKLHLLEKQVAAANQPDLSSGVGAHFRHNT